MTSPRLRTALGIFTAATVLLALTGCVESGRGDTSRTVGAANCPVPVDASVKGTARIGFQQIPNGDMIVKDRGWLAACLPNATINWSNFASGQDVVQAFASGSLDLGTLGSSPATKALSAPLNLPVRVVWIQDVIGKAESLAVRDPAITSLAGLRGKRIATPFGSTSHYSLLSALSAAGLTSDVTLINLKPDAILAAWQRKEIDAAWVWDPSLSTLLADGHVVTSSAEVAAAGAPTFDLSAGRTEFLTANPKFMLMWTRLQNFAAAQIAADPAAAATSIAAQFGTTPEVVRPQLRGYTYPTAADQAGPAYLGGGFADNLAGTAKFLLQQGGIDAVSPSYSGGIDSTAVRAVAAQ
ncbi:MAG: glycine betaine transporter substrate-binding protein [Nocardia sp.]|uniref:taurine ABC transporter substrate-binding protein n=1 Tax=Nocardia sp. TaxID=1821 RepID=UPI0026226E14|nr:glycine betaine ABC transporter substrate-binding protein [Nocardia sp.]MCU1642264.1 glycine betaine transporter substrate-binding protein [Nocardia sp.]